MKRRTKWLGLTLAACCAARAQTSGSAAAALAHLAQAAEQYRRDVPNFTCEENVVSLSKRGDTPSLRTEFRATVRVVRAEDDTLHEDFSITRYMGKELSKAGMFTLAIYVDAGLSKGLPPFFSDEEQKCYRYTLVPGRIGFEAASSAPPCKNAPSTHGYATLDAAGDLVHGEIRRSPEDASSHRLITFLSVDYAPVRLMGRPYRMPVHLYAEQGDGALLKTFDAHFTHCKLLKNAPAVLPLDAGIMDSP